MAAAVKKDNVAEVHEVTSVAHDAVRAVQDAMEDARATRLVGGAAQDAVNRLVETATIEEHNATMKAADEAEQAIEDADSVLEVMVIAIETAIALAVEAAAHSEIEAAAGSSTYSGGITLRN